MREPRCSDIVPSKNLWEIAIEFLGKIDSKLIDFNLKLAYIMYKVCKLEKIPYFVTSKLVFLACFNDVGKLYELENKSNSLIETYLFLKYFSPVKDYTNVLLVDVDSFNKYYMPYVDGLVYKACKDYTTYLLKTNNKEEALKLILEHRNEYKPIDIKALEALTKKTDLIYDFNSGHYKNIVYKYSSKMIFSGKEKNKFITMLSSLFEMYSAQTLYHSKVTAIISYKLAKILGLGNKRAKKLYIAGLCHDLGKVCIPLKILEKPDKLTDREFSTMKKHVTFTKSILNTRMDYEIIEMAYRHHEKLDGSGYPNKLKGDYLTIPLVFRIQGEGDSFFDDKELWLTKAVARASSGYADSEVYKALRLFVDRDSRNYSTDFIFNPSATNRGETRVGGLLNISRDEYYDFDTNGEIIYGEYDPAALDLISANPYSGANVVHDVNGVGNTEPSTFVAKHYQNTKYYTNFYSAANNALFGHAEYESISSIAPARDTQDHLTNVDPYNPTSVCKTRADDHHLARVNLTVWLEGWDFSVVDKEISHGFDLGLTFEMSSL